MANVEELLKIIVSEQFSIPEQEINLRSNLVTDFKMDSLDCIELIMECEDVFEILIKEEEAENIKTVQEAFDLITNKIEQEQE